MTSRFKPSLALLLLIAFISQSLAFADPTPCNRSPTSCRLEAEIAEEVRKIEEIELELHRVMPGLHGQKLAQEILIGVSAIGAGLILLLPTSKVLNRAEKLHVLKQLAVATGASGTAAIVLKLDLRQAEAILAVIEERKVHLKNLQDALTDEVLDQSETN